MEIVLAAVAAALVGLAGPTVIARLPEPVAVPADEAPSTPAAEADLKPRYADIARAPGLAAWFGVAAAAAGALVAWRLPEPALVPVWVAVVGVGSWLAYVDWRTRLLPFRLTVPLHAAVLALVALAALLLGDPDVLVHGLVGNVAVFAVFWVIWLVGTRFGGAFGYGDVRLAAIIGLALGPLGVTATLAGTYGGFLLGAVCGLVLSRTGVVDRAGFAFGPYLVAGAVLGVVVAPAL